MLVLATAIAVAAFQIRCGSTQHGTFLTTSCWRNSAVLPSIATLTTDTFNDQSSVSASVIRRRFGSWNLAMKRAGLSPTSHGRRYSDSDYYENLLLVWSHLARQPTYNEMNLPPSRITAGGYEKKWGTWRKALLAFIAQVSSSEARPVVCLPSPAGPSVSCRQSAERDPRRKVPLGLRSRYFSVTVLRACSAAPVLPREP